MYKPGLPRFSALQVTVFAWAAFAAIAAAKAQDLIPLKDYLSLPEDRIEISYAPVRCASLYYAINTYVGRHRMGAEAFNSAIANIETFSVIAVLSRMEQSGANQQVTSDAVNRDILAISNLYIERFHNNYRATGSALVSDPLIQGDFEICRFFLSRQ